MNYVKSTLIICIGILLISCGAHYTKNKKILRAEALLSERPGSAQKVLLSMPYPEKLSRADYAAWCLLYTHTQYKLEQDIKSDSLIRLAISYYEGGNLPVQSGTAYYLLGCVAQLKNNNKDAMQAYKKAEDLLTETNEEDLKGLVEFGIASLYLHDALFDQSIINYKTALRFFVRSNNKKYQAFAYRAVSDMYVQLHRPFDSIMHYSNVALKLAAEVHDTMNYYSILAQQGELLSDRDYDCSKSYLLKGYQFFPDKRSYYAAYLSYVYSKLQQPDSARYYLNITLADTGNTADKTLQSIAAAYVSKDEGNLSKAFHFLEQAYQERDTIFQQSIRSQLREVDKQYDLTKKEKENAALKISEQHKNIINLILVIVVLLLLFIILSVKSLHKKKTLKAEMEHELQQQHMQYELKMKEKEDEQNRRIIFVKLQDKLSNTLVFNKLNMSYSQESKREEFVKQIIEQSVLAEEDWQHYIDEMDQVFKHKISGLLSLYPGLSKLDLIVITLIGLNVKISNSCTLLNMNKATMYKRRNRIKERIGMESESDMEDWVEQYLK
jgi:hypothetical protein